MRRGALDGIVAGLARGLGTLPAALRGGHLTGLVTDRDIVIEVLAAGKDPSGTRVIDLVHGEAVTIGADDSVEEAIQTMKQHKVRRLPSSTARS